MTTREPLETILRGPGIERVDIEEARELAQRSLDPLERLDIRSVHESMIRKGCDSHEEQCTHQIS
jgi:hypothetical protein